MTYDMKTHLMKLTAFVAVMLSCATAMAGVSQHPSLAKGLVKGVADSLSITNTSIAFGDKVLLHDMDISIAALDSTAVPELDFGMFNVSVEGEGYRFLPHGTHFDGEGATVRLKYDRTRIPSGYTEDDIRTYYFDSDRKCWVALPRVEVDKQSACVVSKTTHFTDMINGVIVAPESPETDAFTPTMMNDIKAADPTSKINIIMPPTANNRGSANLTYPFEMPPARNGMQPQVALSYNSDGGSGWAGEGWDISIPTITVDTRWGVPRYNDTIETETYLLNGQMLAMMDADTMTVAHRKSSVDRQLNRQFFLRQGGDFSKIIRVGDSPSNYHWEITDRNGVVYTYGGNANAVLKGAYTDAGGYQHDVIAEWKLTRVQETHGDYINYYYSNVEEQVVPGLSAKANYLSRIEAGSAGQDTAHTIVYFFPNNLDKTIKKNNARYGFLTSSNRLLGRIEVHYQEELLRSYTFDYKNDTTFHKDQLKRIAHLDNNNQEVAFQEFDYYDDVICDGSYVPFENSGETWNLNGQSSNNLLEHITQSPSALGGNANVSWGLSLYAGVGMIDGSKWKGNTVGSSYTYSHDTNQGVCDFIDLNGDSRPDKVYVNDGHLFYCPQKIDQQSGQIVFGEPVEIQGIHSLSKSKSKTHTFNIIPKTVLGWMELTGSYSREKSKTTTETTEYFNDINGDGLIDFVSNGQVYFNHLNNSGTPTFTLSSGDTPSPIKYERLIDESLYTIDNEEQAELVRTSPMIDMVRVWQAPQDGDVNISGTVQRIIPDVDYDVDEYAKADKLIVSVQRGDIILWSTIIEKDNSNEILPTIPSIHVNKGNKIYFRVQCGSSEMSNGAFDNVRWAPTITYTGTNKTMPNGYSTTVYQPVEGAIYDSDTFVRVNSCDSIEITGKFIKPLTTDDVVLRVIGKNDSIDSNGNRNQNYVENIIFERVFSASTIADSVDVNATIENTQQYSNYCFELTSTSNIRWDEVKWMPSISYIENDTDTVSISVPAHYRLYAKRLRLGEPYQIHANDSLLIVSPGLVITDRTLTGDITLSVKTANRLISKKTYSIVNGTFTSDTICFVQRENEEIWFEYHFAGVINDNSINNAYVRLSQSDGPTNSFLLQPNLWSASLYSEQQNEGFGLMYRGWGGFAYNASENRYASPIDESLLHLPQSITETIDVLTEPFIQLGTDQTTVAQWIGQNRNIYLTAFEAGAARLGEQDVTMSNPLANNVVIAPSSGLMLQGTGAAAVNQISKSSSIVDQEGFLSLLTLNQASGDAEAQQTMLDMNGDGFPDVVSYGSIQYTNTLGGLSGEKYRNIGNEKSSNSSHFAGIGDNPISSISNIAELIKTGKITLQEAQTTWAAQISVSGGENWNHDELVEAFIDINGDGLPDKILSDKRVMLNLGYDFTEAVEWGIDTLKKGRSNTIQTGLGGGAGGPIGGTTTNKNRLINKASGSFSVGVGFSESETVESYCLLDVNGDGLPDKIKTMSTDDHLMNDSVAMNMGNRFDGFIEWNGAEWLNTSTTNAASVNAAFTATLNIPAAQIKVCVNPGASTGYAMYRPTYVLRDVDGDGFMDIACSEDENVITVKRSTIARTNKLKTVTNSLGGKFTVDYKHSTPTYGLPGGKWVMSSVDVDYGIDYNDYKIPNTKTIYEYGHGVRDRHEREFLGFGEVVSKQYYNRPNDQRLFRQTVEEYDTASIYTAGSLLSTRVENSAGDIMTKTENEYYMFGIKNSNSNNYGGTYRFDTTFVCWNDRGAAYAPIKYSQNRQYERTDTGTVMSESWYQYYVSPGDHGLLRNYKYSNKGGLGCSGNGAFDYRTNISYHSVLDGDHHIFGLPLRVKVYESPSRLRHSIKASYSDAANPTQITGIVRLLGYVSPIVPGENQEGLNGLDAGTATTNGLVGPGDGVVGPNYPGLTGPDQEPDLEPQYAKIEASTTYTYDSYGNLKTVTLPSNGYNQNLTYTCKYDSTMMNMYPVEVADSYGYESTSGGIDYRYGITRQMHDIHEMDYFTYTDDLGRVTGYNSPIEISQIRTGSGDVNNPPYYTVKYDYEPKAIIANNGKISRPAYAITWNLNKRNGSNADYIKTITFVDGFGRPIQVQKESIIQNAAGDGTEHVLIVSGQQIFDEFGRVEKSYYPTTLTYTDNIVFSDQKDSVEPTETTYDVLDRLDYVEFPNGREQYYEYAIGDHTIVSQFYDENEHLSETYTDGSGRTVKSIQYKDVDNSQPLTTSFEYDGIGRLVKVTDTEGNETLSQYDMGDRRVSVTHPASGKTTFSYAANGSLLTKKTANMQGKDKEIRYKYNYDQLDSIFYPDHPENNVVYHYGNRSDNAMLKGRVKLRIDGTGATEYDYGMLGEVTKERRTVIVPNHEISTFVTQWVYDSHNRLKQMTYPDGTLVNYDYDDAGQLNSVSGTRDVEEYDYVSDIRYDKFGDRVYMQYGNGAVTTYQYTPQMRRLRYLTVKGLYGNDTIRTAFTYDSVGNIKSVNRYMRVNGTSGMLNGTITHTYKYDPLYRLIKAEGHFGGDQANYSLDMSYDDLYRITRKKQELSQSNIQFEDTLCSGYDLDYAYSTTPGKRFQMANVSDVNYRTDEEPTEDDAVVENHCYEYDNNGNIIYVNTSRTMPDVGFQSGDVEKMREERFRWDEENRLLAISQNGYVSQYWYDADGERVVKEHGANQAVFVNSEHNGTVTQTDRYSVYPNGYYSYGDDGRYTKHIYIGAERIVSQVGGKPYPSPNTESVSVAGRSNGIDIRVDYSGKLDQHLAQIDSVYDAFDLPYNGTNHDSYYNNYFFDRPGYWDNTEGLTLNGSEPEMPRSIQDRDLLYYYHRDHLGSSTAVSNDDGKLSQQIEYLPYGEVFLEKQMASSDYHSPYKFNGKELDEETGLYYYGARYMNPRLSIWYCVDPISNFDPRNSENHLNGEHNNGVFNPKNLNPYIYCYNNPIIFVDPNGKQGISGAVLGAFIGAFTEYASIVGEKMLFEGKSFSQANKEITLRNIGVISLAAITGGASGSIDNGITRFSSWIAKGKNQKIVVKLLELGVDVLEDALGQYIERGQISVSSMLIAVLTKTGMNKLLSDRFIRKAQNEALHNLKVAEKRLSDLQTRGGKNERLIRQAQEKVKECKSCLDMINAVMASNEAVNKTMVKSTTRLANEKNQ